MGVRRIVVTVIGLLVAVGCGDDTGQVAGSLPATTTTTAAAAAATTYEASTTVLESPEHGPELCLGGVEESYPPQCGGPPVVGWSWEDVTAEESSAGTTWVDAHVVGTWDGESLTLTEPPGPWQPDDEPDGYDFSPACDEPVGDAAADPFANEGVGHGPIPDLVDEWVSDPAGPDWDGPYTLNLVVLPGAADAATEIVRRTWAGPLCVIERDAPTVAELARAQDEVFDLPGDDNPLGIVLGGGVLGNSGFVSVAVAVLTEEAVAYARDRWGDLVELRGVLQPVADG